MRSAGGQTNGLPGSLGVFEVQPEVFTFSKGYVTTYENVLYRSDETLQMFDISDPTKPQLVGMSSDLGYGEMLIFDDHLIVNNEHTLYVNSLEDPQQPVPTGTLAHAGGVGSPSHIVASAEHLVVAHTLSTNPQHDLVEVISINAAGVPVVDRAFELDRKVDGIALAGGSAYVRLDGGDTTEELLRISLADASVLGSSALKAGGSVHAWRDYVVLSAPPQVVIEFDQDSAELVTSWDTRGSMLGFVTDDVIAVANALELSLFSVADPLQPKLLGAARLPAAPLDMVVQGSVLYLSGDALTGVELDCR